MAAKLVRVLTNGRHYLPHFQQHGHGTLQSLLRSYSAVPGSSHDDWPSGILKPWEDVDDDSSYHHELGKRPSTSPIPSNTSCPAGAHGPVGANGLPTYVDWRVEGAVIPVQSQRNCGSCWAMAATAAVEGINFKRTGDLVKLSEQQLVDCNHIKNHGCCYGNVREAFRYIIRTGGLVEAKYYPYVGYQNVCKRIVAPAVTIDSYELVVNGTEFDLLQAIAEQPTCVMVKADNDFSRYSGRGILNGPIYDLYNLDHYITMVAYYPDCFVGKNSWGTKYGDMGFVRIARRQGPGGAFGIYRWIIYPLKKSANNWCRVRSDADMGVIEKEKKTN